MASAAEAAATATATDTAVGDVSNSLATVTAMLTDDTCSELALGHCWKVSMVSARHTVCQGDAKRGAEFGWDCVCVWGKGRGVIACIVGSCASVV